MQSLRAFRTQRILCVSRPTGRFLSTSLPRSAAFNLRERPGPPRLPKEEQEEYERLQRESTGAFQTSHTVTEKEIEVSESDVHKDIRKGAQPEFEGEVNPKTGEVGGPKNDPLRHSEWTYNGRATDF